MTDTAAYLRYFGGVGGKGGRLAGDCIFQARLGVFPPDLEKDGGGPPVDGIAVFVLCFSVPFSVVWKKLFALPQGMAGQRLGVGLGRDNRPARRMGSHSGRRV